MIDYFYYTFVLGGLGIWFGAAIATRYLKGGRYMGEIIAVSGHSVYVKPDDTVRMEKRLLGKSTSRKVFEFVKRRMK